MNQDTKNSGILLPAYVENISTRKDKTVKITLSTQELTPEKAGDLFSILNKLVCSYFSIKDIDQDEIDMVDKINPEFGGKSQSQRLRSVLYLLWEAKNDGFKDFNNYYHFKTEEIISHYKSKLPKP